MYVLKSYYVNSVCCITVMLLTSCGTLNINDFKPETVINKQKEINKEKKIIGQLKDATTVTESYVNQAQTFIENKNFESAIDKISDAINFLVDFSENNYQYFINRREEYKKVYQSLHYTRGMVYLNMKGNERNAYMDFRKATEYFPEAYIAAAEAQFVIFDRSPNVYTYNSASSAYAQAINKFPDNKRLFYKSASITYRYWKYRPDNTVGKNSSLRLSYAHLTKALEIDKKYQEAYMLRALIGMELGYSSSGSLRDSGMAVNLNPENPEAHYVKGFIDYGYGNHKYAIEDLQEAIKLEPTNEKYKNTLVKWQQPKSMSSSDVIASLFTMAFLSALITDNQSDNGNSEFYSNFLESSRKENEAYRQRNIDIFSN